MSKLTTRDGTAEPSRETKFSGANGEREILFFSCSADHEQEWQLTWLIHTLDICVTIQVGSRRLTFLYGHSCTADTYIP